MLQNIKPCKDHGAFNLEQISKSKAALHHLLLSVWVIHPLHTKKVFPIFGCKQINRLNDYSKFKKETTNQITT